MPFFTTSLRYVFVVSFFCSITINHVRAIFVPVRLGIGIAKCQFSIPERKLQIKNQFVFNLFFIWVLFYFVYFPSIVESFSAFYKMLINLFHFIYRIFYYHK